MHKKTIKFTDYNDTERVEDHYFNLNEAELIKLLTTEGEYTLDKYLEKLSTERNGKRIMEIFEELIHLSYGKPSLDRRRFDKSDEIWEDFHNTEAYSVLFTELVTDAKKAADFINQIIPKKLAEQVEKIIKENPKAISAEIVDYVGKPERK